MSVWDNLLLSVLGVASFMTAWTFIKSRRSPGGKISLVAKICAVVVFIVNVLLAVKLSTENTSAQVLWLAVFIVALSMGCLCGVLFSRRPGVAVDE